MKFFVMVAVLMMTAHSAMAAETQPGEACAQAGLLRSTGGPGESVARTLICDGTVWRVADERSNAGKTLLQIGNDTGACDADKQGRLRFDGLNVEICNGTLWSELATGAGSGGVRYAGMTPTTYNGSLGGWKGAAEKCHAAFPNSRMMTSEDIIKVARQIPAGVGWVQCSVEVLGASSNRFCASAAGVTDYGVNGFSCSAWAVGITSWYGMTYDNTGSGRWGISSCNVQRAIHCVYD